MRAVVQRASRASVAVDGAVVGALDAPGLAVLVGAAVGDGPDDVAQVVRKVAELRILRGEVSAVDAGAPVLVVSQFTLLADTRRGRRPSWSGAARAEEAEPLVDAVVAGLRARGLRVATGVFGADMALEVVNDGPVTVLLDTARGQHQRRDRPPGHGPRTAPAP
ncbi:D-aminoacyl-tRNA deacylase [Quadrisphaera sp. DSM 44207]|uniref:D-aminoacyl-tRNA deacylase n=1 Tax=Quadrisphaera sp. DSM 44207 TaxID=1881057 RepID=UPI00088E0B76|nr:D-aminoacyl-tRNA deacylase [Quadrisphaera sp. DSM 44207]SDQ83846.1 D-tyrosyl-tRNA(Tyr) deacylase [Quadrisphaera sp. DSM 44207]